MTNPQAPSSSQRPTKPSPLQKAKQYMPPKVLQGATVKFYPTPGAENNYTTATVSRVHAQTVDLVTAEGRPMRQVRYKADPRVAEARIAQYGAWDFTPAYLREQEVYEALSSQEASSATQLASLGKSVQELGADVSSLLDGRQEIADAIAAINQRLASVETDIKALMDLQSAPPAKPASNTKAAPNSPPKP